MEISYNLRKTLEGIGNDKALWDRHIEIEGDMYFYSSARNEFRKVANQPSGTIAILIGCMAFGQFIKCC